MSRAFLVNGLQLFFVCSLWFMLVLNASWDFLKSNQLSIALVFGTYMTVWLWSINRIMTNKLHSFDIALSTTVDYCFFTQILLFQYTSNEGAIGNTPMFSYIFLLIVIRSLHLKASIVLYSGACAAAAWGIMVFITLIFSGLDTAARTITWKEFMVSGLFDRFFTIVTVTGVLAYMTNESRKYFESAIVRAFAGQGLAKFIGTEIASKIVSAGGDLKPGHGRMARAAILMIDLRNFTQTASTMKPTAVMSLLQDYQSLVVSVVTARGGIIDKFMGDGILVHFGAVSTSSTYAADALISIEEILYKSEIWQTERRAKGLPSVDLRAACSVGDVVFGAVGGGGRMEFTIIGDAVNTTAKLEKFTKILGAKSLVTSRAFETAKAQGYMPQSKVERFTNQTIPGLTRTVDLVAISQPVSANIAPPKPKAKAS